MHKSSMHNMLLFVTKYLKPVFSGEQLHILDVGSRSINGGYKKLFDGEANWYYEGMDITPGINVDIVVPDIYNWGDIANDKYDIVICGQVFEHIEYPWLTIHEINRVLRPGGLTCIIAPSSGFIHRFPVDCYRYFPDGMTALARWGNLEVVEVYNCWNDPDIGGEHNTWKDTVLIARKP